MLVGATGLEFQVMQALLERHIQTNYWDLLDDPEGRVVLARIVENRWDDIWQAVERSKKGGHNHEDRHYRYP